MPQLPGCEDAVLDVEKLRDYCLSPHHPRGRHKARVFRQVLGLTDIDAAELRLALLKELTVPDAVMTGEDSFGTRWRVDIPLERNGRYAIVRTAWIIEVSSKTPRFLTCWIAP